MNRRKFVTAGSLAMVSGLAPKQNIVGEDQKNERPLKIGFAGFTFAKFDLDGALEIMKKVDVPNFCVKDFQLPLNSTPAQIQSFKDKLSAAGVSAYGVGVIYMKTAEEVERAFDYANRAEIRLIVGVPNVDLLPLAEKKAKELGIRLAIHNHGPEDEMYPDADTIMSHIKDMDNHLGLCLDIGHNLRNGKDPIKAIEQYHDRIYDIHLKNISAAVKDGSARELGRGVIDIPALAKTLIKHGYAGFCGLEYEKDMESPLAGIAESIGYFRGVLDTL